jgi:hypothetical protein
MITSTDRSQRRFRSRAVVHLARQFVIQHFCVRATARQQGHHRTRHQQTATANDAHLLNALETVKAMARNAPAVVNAEISPARTNAFWHRLRLAFAVFNSSRSA